VTGEYTTELDGRAEPLLGPNLGPPQDSPVHSAASRRKLERKAIDGTIFVGLTTAGSMALRLLNSLIFAYLFLPAYFGLLSLATAIIVGLYLFSHLGLQDNVIQNPRGDEPSFVNTAWTIEYIRGYVIASGCWILAWPVSRFYHQPILLPVLIALGFTCIISGHTSPVVLSMARHLRVRELTMLELFNQLVTCIVTVAWALISPTIWALVGGRIIAEAIRCAATYWFKPFAPPRFAWDRDAVKAIVRFGKWIMVGTALTFLASQSDKLILGKLITFSLLGLYGVAYSMSDIPRQIINQFCTKVGFPFLAKFQKLPRPEYRTQLLKYRKLVLLGGALLLTLVVCLGDLFIHLVYNHRYHDAAWMVGILGVGLWHTLLYSTISPAIFALQRSHYNAFAQAVYCVTLFAGLPWGFHHYGMVGVLIVVAAADLPMYFCFQYAAFREGINTVVQDVLLTGVFIAILVGALALRHAIGFGSPFPAHLM
jgi:O-antigen/teichoic acid export membrane protein